MEINEYGKLVDTNNEMVVAHKTAQLLDKFDLNWIVEKQPLLLPSGNQSINCNVWPVSRQRRATSSALLPR
jgi:hypothetical protein